ncbi:DNA-directed RNA polymerase subunit beta [Bacillus sp. FJAT-47783]|uniref:DNA-directed RNA polymerase subunit beta n=1 Tax=Bacillus sp. FJAT-47783 TaxID=2922712 RepID=UPI001FAD83DE|nr:DNA-directed RNA polymerase subunit beta [Bacillus sp. FJAT-47783]
MSAERISIREQSKKENKTKTEEQTEPKKVRIRLIPIWLRLILVVFAMAISVVIGAMVGYGVLGDGKPLDALKPSTWQHIVDLVEKEKE